MYNPQTPFVMDCKQCHERSIEMKKKSGIILFLIILLIPGMLSAADSKNYGVVNPGYFLPNGDQEGLEDFDGALSFGAAYGRFLTDKIAIEIGLDYYSVKGEIDGSLDLPGYSSYYDSILQFEADAEITVWAVPVTGKYHFFLADKIKGYIGGGIGFYMVDFEEDYSWRIPGIVTVKKSISDSGNCIGFHLVTGADYTIRPDLLVGAAVKWHRANQEVNRFNDDQMDFNIGGLTIAATGKLIF